MDDTCEVEDEGVSDHRKVAVTLEASFQAEIVGKVIHLLRPKKQGEISIEF
ncbi:hypothetical protein AXX17_AT3G32000 [Arabidopsis thaliana]|uniref:Uncharacterized protein n=2 Tax=Arabidopsis TaxID=3701 RepID=A0A178VIV8_ARATH|nr:hypothetical protein AXX17_AT3G32000 [Arabidopsis thaliana]